jgi:hypothetical protein
MRIWCIKTGIALVLHANKYQIFQPQLFIAQLYLIEGDDMHCETSHEYCDTEFVFISFYIN